MSGFPEDYRKIYEEIIHNYSSEILREEIIEIYGIIKEIDSEYKDYYKNEETETPAQILQETVAKWYYNLRNLALVCLLIILVYIGIRIVLSSTAPEKAKYKQMIMNWVVAICILFLLHIIMLATLKITETITSALAGGCVENILIELPIGMTELDGEAYTATETTGLVTNFVGYIRYIAGVYYDEGSSLLDSIAYIAMYIMLVVQTLMFTWVYLKRVVYMAFLTIISPLVAITYPIDKIGDGKSQAFDLWLKEYIFNALLQPIHLLIYTVLCGTAMEIVTEVPIYGIVCLAFIVPAEKFIRKMFGFEKAQTPSALGGAAGTALAMSGIQKIGNMIRPDGRDDREAEAKPKAKPKAHKIRQVDTAQLNTDADSAKKKAGGIGASNNIRGASNPQGNTESKMADDFGKSSIRQREMSTNEINREDNFNSDVKTTDEESVVLATQIEQNKKDNLVDLNQEDEIRMIPETDDKPISDDNATSDNNPVSKDNTKINDSQIANGSNNSESKETAYSEKGTEQTSNKKAYNPQRFTSRMYRIGGGIVDNWKSPKNKAKIRRKIRRNIRSATRKIAGGMIGVGAGFTMAAAKLATGSNANEVATAATVGGAAGYAIGNKGTQKIQEGISTAKEKAGNAGEIAKEGWYTSDEKQQQYSEEAMKEYMNNPENKKVFRENFGPEWKEVMQSSFTRKALRHGVEKPEDIVAAYNYMNSDVKEKYAKVPGITTDELEGIAIQSARNAAMYGDVRNDKKKRDEMEATWRNLYSTNPETDIIAEQEHARQEADMVALQAQKRQAESEYNRKAQEMIEQARGDSEKEEDRTLYEQSQIIKEEQKELEKLREEAEKEDKKHQEELIAEKNELESLAAEQRRLQQEISNGQAYTQAGGEEEKAIKELQEQIRAQEEKIRTETRAARKKVMKEKKKALEEQYEARRKAFDSAKAELRRQKSDLQNINRSVQQKKEKVGKREESIGKRTARIAELESSLKTRKDERAQMLQERLKTEYEKVKEAKQTVKAVRVQTVEEIKAETVEKMVRETRTSYDSFMKHKDNALG